jgi:hypothetical protein
MRVRQTSQEFRFPHGTLTSSTPASGPAPRGKRARDRPSLSSELPSLPRDPVAALAIVNPRYSRLPGIGRNTNGSAFAVGPFACYATLTGRVYLIVCGDGTKRFAFI